MLDMNLQLFSEDTEQEEKTTEEVKTFTEEEFNKRLQSETDRRVTEAIKKREEKLREEMTEKIEAEKKQAEELAKLSEKEKAEKLFQMEKEKFEAERKEFERARLELEASKILDERKLPVKFTKYVVAQDAETTLKNIDSFQTEWQEAIQREIDSRLKGKTPQKGDSVGTYNPWSKETFNLTEQGKIMQDNPALAQQLRAAARK